MPEEFKTAQNLRRQIRDVAQYRATVQNLGDHADSTFVTPRQVRKSVLFIFQTPSSDKGADRAPCNPDDYKSVVVLVLTWSTHDANPN